MSFFFQALVEIDTHLQDLGVRWALMGGLAVSLRAEPRTTHDIDLGIAVAGDRDAENFIRDIRARGYQQLDEGHIENKATGRIAIMRFMAPIDHAFGKPIVDFLFDSSGIEPEIVEAAEMLDVMPGVALPVITMGHLLAVKTLASRPKDVADIASLLRFAREKDLRVAREALLLISRRGADGGVDLQMKFEKHLESFAGA